MSERDSKPEPATDAKAPAPAAAPVRPPKPWYRKWRYRIPLLLIVTSAVVIGPWPADTSTYVGSAYQQSTLDRLAAAQPLSAGPGPIRVGTADLDITPPVGHKLAGYGEKSDKRSTGIRSRCHTRALSIARGDKVVTILCTDILIINQKMADAVRSQTGLSPHEIYFTATHTHSGPGQWGDHSLEEIVAGSYSPEFFRTLTQKMAEAVIASRQNLADAEMAVLRLPTERFERQKNRVDNLLPTHDWLYGLFFRRPGTGTTTQPGELLAALAVFSAHPTASGLHSREMSADYPGGLAERLHESGVGVAMFAAGTVGDSRPKLPPGRDNPDRAIKLGRELADRLMAALPSAHWQAEASLASLNLPVDLPPLRLSISRHWRLSPICTRWIRRDATRLQALRIGPATLVGMPGDYAGMLGNALDDWNAGRHGTLIATSFAADYVGYVMPRSVFNDYWSYETRLMNFYGPWLGEYLNDTAERMIDRLGQPEVE
ncbi:MAG: hypothetical protein BIFFINMI_00147 [Phycisphaerae bacterium]|nr:hypothetical protein [Phycisphaerae bacterium]